MGDSRCVVCCSTLGHHPGHITRPAGTGCADISYVEGKEAEIVFTLMYDILMIFPNADFYRFCFSKKKEHSFSLSKGASWIVPQTT